MPAAVPPLEPATQRALAAGLFNRVWALLDLEVRDDAQVDEMVHAAHASAYHWMQVGTGQNRARSEWHCSRVYAVLSKAEASLRHARRSLAFCKKTGAAGLDLGYAYEALARAEALAGDRDQSAVWLDRARAAAGQVTDDEDRQLLLADLATIATGG